MNLIANAADALEGRSGTVWIRTGTCMMDDSWLHAAHAGSEAAPGPHAYVEVEDNGIGMTPETVARVFDPFFTTKFTGRGLGLAAVLGIVRGHRGAIRILSEPGKGSKFVVAFPVCEDPEVDEAEHALAASAGTDREGSQQAEGAGAEKRRDGLVLVIDDESSVRSLARTALERAGFHVLTAESGEAGLELFERHQAEVAAVVIDMTMPGMSGRDVAQAIHARDPAARLIGMSGYADFSLDAEGAKLGLSGFIAKPFRLAELANAVERACKPLG
jgi:CheY-like chemotaxis protein